jgi:DNA ligase-1
MKPMLAKTGSYTNGRRWCDYKYDGIRAQVHQNADGIKIFNRKGDDITSKFENDLIPLIGRNSDPVDWIVDGEIYPIDADGNPAEFKNIMSRIHGKTDDVIYRNPVTIRLFDCLMYGGQNVYEDILDTRLQTLQMHFDESLVAKTIEVMDGEEMLEFYNEAIEAGFEGVIIKDPNVIYEFGKRSKGWEKYKPPLVDIDVVITGAEMGVGKRAGVYGAYHIAVSDGDELVPFGSVGSGFTDEDLQFMTNMYNQLGPNKCIIEVKGDIITQNENGEYGLRFPRFVKYRDDKDSPTDLKELKI